LRDLADRYGIVMIAPHRGVRRSPTHGCPLRRYRRRWRVERLFAWFHHFCRLMTRWEYHVENFFGMVRLGCRQVLLRYL
jgi:transposase